MYPILTFVGPPFNQRIAIRYHMPALGLEETKAYVTHHLKRAGARNRCWTRLP